MCSQFTDREIIQQLNEHDPTAFEYIYNLYSDQLYLHAYMLLKEDYLTRDVVHDVFEQVLKAMGKLEPSIKIRFWLHACVRNRVVSYIRKERVRSQYLEDLRKFSPEEECTTDHLLRENEMIRIIEAQIAQLPPQMRKTFELSRLKFMNNEEIARETHKSVNTIRNQLQRTLKLLKDRLTHDVLIITFSLIYKFLH